MITFKQMIYDSSKLGEITKEDLKALSMKQLEVFARMLGIPYSGDCDRRIQRIYDALCVRYTLLESDDPKHYEIKYRRRELAAMTKKLNLYVGSTKYGLAVGLLNWRTKCRKEGQKFYQEIQTELAKQPKQVRLF